MIEPIRELLDAGVQSDVIEKDERWALILREEIKTASVKLNATLTRTHDRHTRLLETLTDVFYEVDAEGRFVFVSPAITGLLGYTPEELTGAPFSKLIPPDQFDRARHRINDRRTGPRAARRVLVEMLKKAQPSEPDLVRVQAEVSAKGIKLNPFEYPQLHYVNAVSNLNLGKLEDADGDKRLRARATGAASLSDDELKFRVAGIREAFEECGVLLAHKRGQKPLIGAADLKPIEEKWRKKLSDDEASIVDLVEAEDLEIATDLMVPFAHWITPTFVPKRFDTWFYVALAPDDQEAAHDGSEHTESLWVDPAEAVAMAVCSK